jgi:hypothetical protein
MAGESATITPDLSTTCWTCKPLQTYVDLTQDFVDRLSDALQTPMLMLFASLCGLWIVVSGVKLALQMTDKSAIIKDFVFISITGVLLGSLGASLISAVYTGAISIMGGSSGAVFTLAASAQSSGQSGLVELAANGEQAVFKVFQAASAIARAGSAFNIANYLYAFILVLPYFLLVVAYSSQVVVAIFRATMVGVFAPFLFMAFAFGWARGMAQSGSKTLLAAVLVLFASTAALSLTIYGINAVIEVDPATLTGQELNKFASISNPEFLVVLFLGWMGTALMTEGTSIANSIAQTALTNAAAGIMTAGASASALMAGKKGLPMAGNAAANISKGFSWGQRAIHDPMAAGNDLIKKFQDINKPGGGA